MENLPSILLPYIMLVKVGKPTEKSHPGNQGKQDLQMVLMHFLNKVCLTVDHISQILMHPLFMQVHFNSPMNPCELEIYHQIKNVIGVNPSFYEYIFMVDADMTVEPLALNRLILA